jgi:ABC-2 type transport system permease protein
MPVLIHILYYKLISFLKISTERKTAVIVKNIGSFLVYAGFTIAAYLFSREIISYVLDKIHVGVFLLHRFISMVLYVFFISINIGNIIVAYASLYRSNETKYLLAKPVSFTNLFIVKFLDTFFYSSTTLFLMAIAVLAGYGTYFHLPWTFYLYTLLLLFVPFMLLSAALGVIVLLVFMKIARFLGMRILFVGIVLGYIGTLYVYFNLTNPVQLVRSVMNYYPYVDLYFGFLDAPAAKYIPSYWVAESLYWTIRGNYHLAAMNTSVLLVVCATVLTVMVLLAKALYYESWLTSLELHARSEAKSSQSRFFAFSSKPLFLGNQLSVLMKKEFWQFFREPSQWIHLGIISMLVAVFVVSVSRMTINFTQPFLQTVSYLVIYIFNAFLISSIALRFVFPMISTEGQAFWSIRSAPVTMKKFFWMKFFFATLPLVVLGEVLVFQSHQPLAEYHTLIVVAIISLFFVMLSMIGMNLSLGAYFSDFKESNPIKVASSQGATITFLFTVILLVVLVAILVLPLMQYFEGFIKGYRIPYGLMYYALSIIVLISIAVLFLSAVIGLRVLKRDL